MADSKERDTVQQYVGDMLALEEHIGKPLKNQVDQFKDNQNAHQAIQRFHSMVDRHQKTLSEHLKTLGGSESSPVKSAVADVFGLAAGIIDRVRTEGVSKSLRDDYTAFNLAIISYDMLYTTAKLLGFDSTATLAQQLMQDYTQAVKEIENIIPGVVAWELEKDGHRAFDQQSINQAQQVLFNAWRDVSNETLGSSASGSTTSSSSSMGSTSSSSSTSRS